MNRLAVAVCGAVCAIGTPAAAQHEHHGAARLDTLTARAERDAIQLRSGATIVDPRTSTAAGGSVADLLRSVPGLELGADGRLALRGNASVLVLVNGRRIALTGDGLAAFLRQLPATALERIEVGTIASARHDANGAGGAVNLVFREGSAATAALRAALRAVSIADASSSRKASRYVAR